MKKMVSIILIMAAMVFPQGYNIRLFLRGFSTLCEGRECFYGGFGWTKKITIKGECPSFINYNRDTGGWTR